MIIDTLFIIAFIRSLTDIVAFFLSATGATLVIWGGLKAGRRAFWIEAEPWKGPQTPRLEDVRRRFGQRIVLGLEFFIAGDIVRLLMQPGLQELGRVGALVLIRVILSYVVTRELQISMIVPPAPDQENRSRKTVGKKRRVV